MKQLKSLDLAENTLIIFTSDNGSVKNETIIPFFDSNGPLRGGKRDLYEGGIRVPFIAHWTGTIAPNSISDHQGAFWDVFPTLAHLTKQSIPSQTDGISFLPTLLGQNNQKQHDYLYWEFHEGTGAQAIVQNEWKAIRMNTKEQANSPVELYHLKKDVGEQQNVAADYPERVEALQKLMTTVRTPSRIFPLAVD